MVLDTIGVELAQKYAFTKISTIFSQLFWNLAKFHNDWVKIVDFLGKAYFWASRDLGATLGSRYNKLLNSHVFGEYTSFKSINIQYILKSRH